MEVDSAVNGNAKGKALERLMHQLFAEIDDFEVYDNVRTETEEIDLWVEHSAANKSFRNEEPIILVECKNWTGKVGKNDFVILQEKMRNRSGRCSLAVLVSWNGFADTITKEMLRSSKNRLLIIPLDGETIRQSIKNNNFAETLIKAKRKSISL